jgi:hypothetical protein
MHAMTAILSMDVPEAEKLKAILHTIEDVEPAIRELASYCSKLMFKDTTPDVQQRELGTREEM